MSSLENLNEALDRVSLSEKAVWDFVLGRVVAASVEGMKDSVEAKKLLDCLERVHSHLINAENLIQVYEDLKVSGFISENVGALKSNLQTFSKKVNLDIQALKAKS